MIRGTWLPDGVGVAYPNASKGGFELECEAFEGALDKAAARPFIEGEKNKPFRPAFIPALYAEGKPRHGAHIVALTGIAMDVDCKRGKHAPFDAAAALVRLPFRAFAWTTQGHGSEKKGSDADHPRVRFFVPLAEPFPVENAKHGARAQRVLVALLERYGFTKDAGADPAGVYYNQAAVLPSQPDPNAIAPQWRASNALPLLSPRAIPTADGGEVSLAELSESPPDDTSDAPPALSAEEVAKVRAEWAGASGCGGDARVRDAIASAVARIAAAVQSNDGRKRAAFWGGRGLGSAFATGAVTLEERRRAETAARALLRLHPDALSQLERGLEQGLERPMKAPSKKAQREPLLSVSARLEAWFDDHWLAPGTHVAAVDMGVGKSHTMRVRAAGWMLEEQTAGGCGLIIVPTQDAARETVEALRAEVARQGGGELARLRIRLDHGRSALESSPFHCERHAEHGELARVSKALAKAFCDGCDRRHACAFLRHHRGARRDPDALGPREVLVRTQARQRDADDGAAYAWLVCDESLPAAEGHAVTRDQLLWALGAKVLTGGALEEVAKLEEAQRSSALALLGSDAGFDAAAWQREIERAGTTIGGLPSEDALRALASAAAAGWHGVEIDRNGSVVIGGTYPKPLQRPAACIVLDGTATELHARAQWGEVTSYTEHRAESLGRVVAVVGEGALTPDAVLPRKGRSNAKAWARYLAFHSPVEGMVTLHILRLAILRHPWGQALRRRLEAAGDRVTYVGAPDARGSNAYQDCDRVVCDPYRVPGHAVRAEARALRLATLEAAGAMEAARHVLEHAEILQAVARVRAVRDAREIVTWGAVPGLAYTQAVSLAELVDVSALPLPASKRLRDAAVALVSNLGAATLECVSASIHAGLPGRNTTPQIANRYIGTLRGSVPPPHSPPHSPLDSKAETRRVACRHVAVFATSAGLQLVRVTSSLPGAARAVLYAGDAPDDAALRALFERLGATWYQCPGTGRMVTLAACPWRAAILAMPRDARLSATALARVRGVSASLARRWVRSMGGAEALEALASEIRADAGLDGGKTDGAERAVGGGGVTVTDVTVAIDPPTVDSIRRDQVAAVSFEHADSGGQLSLLGALDEHAHPHRGCIPSRIDARTG